MPYDQNEVYLIRPRGINDRGLEFEVAKFCDHKYPEDTYTVTLVERGDASQAHCTCMGFRSTQLRSLQDPKCGQHKHIRLVLSYLAHGSPYMAYFYFDANNDIIMREFQW